ncbi:MAG: ATP-binding protein [Flavobacteriales bacterium]|nr:ATP-binding protein [Flavobacteriales bacterium]
MTYVRHITNLALDRLRNRPVVAILGARQVGKTTLSHQLVKQLGMPSVRLDLEDPDDRAALRDPKQYLLAHANDLVVIDEVHRMPDLFPLIRTLVDRDRRPGRFLLLGSSSPVIIRRASESLAGRVAYLDLLPFSVHEVPAKGTDRLWLRGGFPEAYLADDDAKAFRFLNELIRSFIERDLPELGLQARTSNTEHLLRMLAHMHGNPLNMAILGKSIGLSTPTIRHYLDFFGSSYYTFTLPGYYTNLRKRLTRAPKIYLSDSGVLHRLLSIRTAEDLFVHPQRGHSWEGFVIQQVRSWLMGEAQLHYFRTQDGAELDLVITQSNKAIAALEIKTTNNPTLSKGNLLAFEAVNAPLQLVVTPSAKDHPYGDGIEVCSLATLWKRLEKVVK